jgi:hypothetical protein
MGTEGDSAREEALVNIQKAEVFWKMQAFASPARFAQAEIIIASWRRQFDRIELEGGFLSNEKFRDLSVSVGTWVFSGGAPSDDVNNPPFPPQGAHGLTPSTPEGNAAGREIARQETRIKTANDGAERARDGKKPADAERKTALRAAILEAEPAAKARLESASRNYRLADSKTFAEMIRPDVCRELHVPEIDTYPSVSSIRRALKAIMKERKLQV